MRAARRVRVRPARLVSGRAIDANPYNYTTEGFREDRQPLPCRVPIDRGTKLYLMQNAREEDDLIIGWSQNEGRGMEGTLAHP